jgi:glutathione synthase/RimK-type ligase-like ATP-grasp enzyme
MTRVAFATCEPRQPMWDDDVAAATVLGEAGIEVDFVAWDSPATDWTTYDRVIVRSAWDYSVRLGEFLGWAESIGADRLRNSPEIIRWNSDKRYLAELDGAGILVPPTLLVAPGGRIPDLDGEFVIKPVNGAGARDTGRFGRDAGAAAHDLLRRLGERDEIAMVQPYIDAIEEHGETSLIVIAGRVSWAVSKGAFLPPDSTVPADPDGIEAARRDQELVRLVDPAPAETELAERAVGWLSSRFGTTPLFARVDLVSTDSGEPVLMEFELIEPSLYLGWAADLDFPGAEVFAAAVIADLG